MRSAKWTWFDCPKCGMRFHIRRCNGGQWNRFMPPKYCPECGAKAGRERVEDEK